MGLFNSAAWFTLIPAAIASLSWLLPAQRYVRIYRDEGFDKAKFIARYDQDREYRKLLNKYWMISLLIMFGIFLGSIILANYITSDFSVAWVVISTIIAVYNLFVLLFWFIKHIVPENHETPFMLHRFGLFAFLGLSYVIEGTLLIFCIAAVYYGILYIMNAFGASKYLPGFLYCIVFSVIIRMVNCRPLFEERLLIFSYALIRPKEKREKKNIA